MAYFDDKKREIYEAVFDLWRSDDNFRAWYAEKFVNRIDRPFKVENIMEGFIEYSKLAKESKND